MTSLAIKNLLAHRRRFIGTFLASFLGVAFLAGTLVLGDTLQRNFDTLFTDANAGTDVVVRSTEVIKGDGGPSDAQQRGLVDAALVSRVQSVDGVAAVAPEVQGYGQILDEHGKAIGGNGPPRMAGSWITDPQLNPYRLASGRAPRTPNEIVINQGAADDGGLHLGDTTIVQTPDPVPVRIVGIATFGDEPGLGGVTYAGFTLEGAQEHILGRTDQVSRIEVRGETGVSQSDLAQRVRSVLPSGAQAVTGASFTREARNDINSDFLTGFRTLLVVFAGIALLVASFSIYNTFSIVVAQRTRESALLRAIGASRRQVLGSVLVEVIGVAVLSSVAGLFAGLGVAGLLKGMFDSFGFALPAGGLVVNTSAIVASLTVGIVITVVAGVAPAVRASRVAPVAALREGEATLPSISVGRVVSAAMLLAAGAAGVAVGLSRSGNSALAPTGLGGLGVLAGVVVAGPLLARPVSRLIGAPIARMRGVTGGLARQNAIRNPRRTASTASALLVGVTVVTLFTVFAASLKAGIDDVVNQSFGGDLVVNTPSFGGGALSPKVAGAVAKVPDVQRAVGIGTGNASVAGDATAVTVVAPRDLGTMLDIGVVKGSLTKMTDDEIAVSDARADDHGWKIGSPVRIGFTDRATVTAKVGAIYHDRQLVGGVVMPRAMYAPHAVQPTDVVVLVDVRDGVSLDQAKASIEKAVAPFGSPDVQDRQEYIASVSSGADLMLGIVYVMLALAIVIALMGIANTLSLAVHERTREVGLLRAVGETRRQVRSMIRWESVIIATFGTALGLGVGVFLAWSLVQAAGSGGLVSFAVPGGRMAVVLVVGAVVGVLAAVRPARRAAKLDVMDAIATA